MANMGSPQVSSASASASLAMSSAKDRSRSTSRSPRAPLTPPPPTITTDLSLFDSFPVVPRSNSHSSTTPSTTSSHDSDHHSFWRSRAALTSQSVTSLSLVADRSDAHVFAKGRDCESSSLRLRSRPSTPVTATTTPRRPATAGADATQSKAQRRRSSSLSSPRSPPPPSYEQCLQDAAASITARMATLYANRDSIGGSSLASTKTTTMSVSVSPTTTTAPRLPGTPTVRVPGSLRAPPPAPLTIIPPPQRTQSQQRSLPALPQPTPTPTRTSFWQRLRRKGDAGNNNHSYEGGLSTPRSAPLPPRTSMSSRRHSRNDSEASIYAFDHDSQKYVRLSEIEGQPKPVVSKKKSSISLIRGARLSIDTGVAGWRTSEHGATQRPAQGQTRAKTDPIVTTMATASRQDDGETTPKIATTILPRLNVNLPLNSPSSWDFGFSRLTTPKSTQDSLLEIQTPPTPPLTAKFIPDTNTSSGPAEKTQTTTEPKWTPTIRVVETQLPPSPVSMSSSSNTSSRSSQSPSPTFGRNTSSQNRQITPMICINDKPYNSDDDESSESESEDGKNDSKPSPSLKRLSAKKGGLDSEYSMYWLAYEKSNPSTSTTTKDTKNSTFLSTEYQFSAKPRTIFNPHHLPAASISTSATPSTSAKTSNYTYKTTLSPKVQRTAQPKPVPISIPDSGEGAERWETVARRRLLGM